MHIYLQIMIYYCIFMQISCSHAASKKIRILGKKKLKIHARYFPRACYTSVVFPEIRLCGKWLTSVGFVAGESVTVHYKRNKIIITHL